MTGHASLEMAVASEDATTEAAKALGESLSAGDVVLLIGDLGAGKTHFAKGAIRGAGDDSEAMSPTFNIILMHDGGRVPIAHMDLYRLDGADQLEDIGFYEMVDESSGVASLIEWADLFIDEMPDDRLVVEISRECLNGDRSGSSRAIRAEATGERGRELLARWRSALEPRS